MIVRKRPPVLQFDACERQDLLGSRNAFPLLNLCLHFVDGVPRLQLQREGLALQAVDKDVEHSAEPQAQVQALLLLDFVLLQRLFIVHLGAPACELDLLQRKALLRLDLGLELLDRVRQLVVVERGLALVGLDADRELEYPELLDLVQDGLELALELLRFLVQPLQADPVGAARRPLRFDVFEEPREGVPRHLLRLQALFSEKLAPESARRKLLLPVLLEVLLVLSAEIGHATDQRLDGGCHPALELLHVFAYGRLG